MLIFILCTEIIHDYPVEEFMDVLNQEKEKGRIKIFGGSNWTIERFKEGNEWAQKNNKQEMSILNNNLALAKMINPLWNGCLSSNVNETLDYLNSTQKSHMSWSSQARGYFLDDKITNEIEKKITEAESSWRNLVKILVDLLVVMIAKIIEREKKELWN